MHDGHTGEQIGRRALRARDHQCQPRRRPRGAPPAATSPATTSTRWNHRHLPRARGEINTLQFSATAAPCWRRRSTRPCRSTTSPSGTRLGDPIAHRPRRTSTRASSVRTEVPSRSPTNRRGDLGPRPRAAWPTPPASSPAATSPPPSGTPTSTISATTGQRAPNSDNGSYRFETGSASLCIPPGITMPDVEVWRTGGTMHRHTALLITSVIAVSVVGRGRMSAPRRRRVR